ncbi:hypothetical protein HEK616_28850 [Streptomyces nigrescens]|uniref:Uncharacterized protein n=2 Tax=Streptomyces TaxID=1883 RepID=A0ABM7ZTD1_STRNI|nr:hypothetical protein [Streptomyces nigrescens]MEE4418255.1 hypothetical protein [Streptomyces sp. DSM 41528]BDM69398.1 hypothetical protein HEK616_28850 [Streptomyces nigrescens]
MWCDHTDDALPAAERLQHTATAIARTPGTGGHPPTSPTTADTARLWPHAPDDLAGSRIVSREQ